MASFRPDGLAETPPVLPPKPGSHEASRINTPSTAGHWNNLPTAGPGPFDHGRAVPGSGVEPAAAPVAAAAASSIPDPGDMWLPQVLQDKSYVFPKCQKRNVDTIRCFDADPFV